MADDVGRVGGADQATHEPSRVAPSRPDGECPSRIRRSLLALRDSQGRVTEDGRADVSLEHLCDVLIDGHDMLDALQPFADAYHDCLDETDLDRADIWDCAAAMEITVAHLRRAVALTASGIEAGTGETRQRLDPKDESPSDAQGIAP